MKRPPPDWVVEKHSSNFQFENLNSQYKTTYLNDILIALRFR